MKDDARSMPSSGARWVTDAHGDLQIPSGARWGAQTARSLVNSAIGDQRMPLELIHAIAWIKAAAAAVNGELGQLDAVRASAIAEAAQRVAEGEFDPHFPLSMWQSGSGTHSQANVSEVVAQVAREALGRHHDTSARVACVDAIDDVSMGQSSLDVFRSAMHIAVALLFKARLLPALRSLRTALATQAEALGGAIKAECAHAAGGAPCTPGQAFCGHEAQLALCEEALRHALPALHTLALDGAAIGPSLHAHPAIGAAVASRLARHLRLPLVQAGSSASALAGHEALVTLHGALRMLAIALIHIGNDIRLMGGGPRVALGDLRPSASGPGHPMAPGRFDSSHAEALAMVCAQVIGHDAAIGFAASQGRLESRVYKPLIAVDTLDSLQLLADAMDSFTTHCVSVLRPNVPPPLEVPVRDLPLAWTAAPPAGGRTLAAGAAPRAEQDGRTLPDAAVSIGAITAAHFDLPPPQHTAGPQRA